MAEYFVKIGSSTEASGPFTPDELKTLALTGKIHPQTPHFYDDLVGWQPIAQNSILAGLLFPSTGKAKLTLKKAAPAEADPKRKEPPVTVESMLEIAQGGGLATKALTAEKRWESRVGALSLPVLALLHLFMGALLCFAYWGAFQRVFGDGFDAKALIMAPGFMIGCVLFVMGVLLLLGLVAVYPAVRYMGFLLIGYLGVYSWSYLYEGLPLGWLLLGGGIGFGLGVYTITLTLNFPLFVLAILVACGGALSYGAFLYLS